MSTPSKKRTPGKPALACLLAACLSVFSAEARSFEASDTSCDMQGMLPLLDSTQDASSWQSLSDRFLACPASKPHAWLPFYYAAYCRLMKGYVLSEDRKAGRAALVDLEADTAESYLDKAESLDTANAEILCLRKMVASLRITAQPMARFRKYQPVADRALEEAGRLDPDNPRVYLLAAQDRFFIPAMLGGSRAQARQLLLKSLERFASHRPASPLHPCWGATQARELLARTQE